MRSGNTFRVGAAAAVALMLTSCGGGDETTTSTSVAAVTTTPTTAPPTTAAPTTVPSTTAAPTTVAPTTAPPTTAAPTTVPLTTSVTVPETTEPAPTALAQFCFDSEQTLVADLIIDEMEEPTPEQIEAALQFLAFSVAGAAETAPPELAEEPQRAAVLVGEIGDAFAQYDFDPDAFPDEAAEALAPTIDEYTAIIDDLQEFLTDSCDSPLGTLEVQAAKLRPIVTDLVTWDLVPIANQAGDVRLLVPEAWNQWFGSDELTQEVSFLQAAPDLQGFDESWNVPGVIATVIYTEPGEAAATEIVAETSAVNDCTETSSEVYEDAVYVGELYRYTDCAGVGTEAIVVAVADADLSREIVVEMQFPDGVDNAVVEQLLASFAAG